MGLNKKVKEHDRLFQQFNVIVNDLNERLKKLEEKTKADENKGIAH